MPSRLRTRAWACSITMDFATPLPKIGQKLKGFIRAVRSRRQTGFEASMPAGYKRVASLTDQIVAGLGTQRWFSGIRRRQFARLHPPDIRLQQESLQASPRRTLPSRRIQFKNPGIELLDNTTYTPDGDEALTQIHAPLRISSADNSRSVFGLLSRDGAACGGCLCDRTKG